MAQWRGWSWSLPVTLAVTRQGVLAAGFLVLRVATAVSWGTLIVLTTRQEDVLRALKVLRVPKTFLAVLGMMYRYLELLLRDVVDTHLAMQSRAILTPSFRRGQRWLAIQIGALLRTSLHLAHDVSDAMCARGYTGEVHLPDPAPLRRADYAWLAGSCLALGGALWWSRP